MKKLIYMSLLICCLVQQSACGAVMTARYALNNNMVARIALELKKDLPAQEYFLEMVKTKEDVQPSFDASDIAAISEEREYVVDAHEIIAQGASSKDSQNIFYADLRGFNFSCADARKVLDYFTQKKLPNLKSLDLTGSTKIGLIIDKLFGRQEPTDKYASLFVINASGSDINNHNLDTIYTYFSRCSCLIRDTKQFSDRYGIVAAFLSVDIRDVRGITAFTGIYGWQRGKKTPNDLTILYRYREPVVKGPLVMSVDYIEKPSSYKSKESEDISSRGARAEAADVSTLLKEFASKNYSEENYQKLLDMLESQYGKKKGNYVGRILWKEWFT